MTERVKKEYDAVKNEPPDISCNDITAIGGFQSNLSSIFQTVDRARLECESLLQMETPWDEKKMNVTISCHSDQQDIKPFTNGINGDGPCLRKTIARFVHFAGEHTPKITDTSLETTKEMLLLNRTLDHLKSNTISDLFDAFSKISAESGNEFTIDKTLKVCFARDDKPEAAKKRIPYYCRCRSSRKSKKSSLDEDEDEGKNEDAHADADSDLDADTDADISYESSNDSSDEWISPHVEKVLGNVKNGGNEGLPDTRSCKNEAKTTSQYGCVMSERSTVMNQTLLVHDRTPIHIKSESIVCDRSSQFQLEGYSCHKETQTSMDQPMPRITSVGSLLPSFRRQQPHINILKQAKNLVRQGGRRYREIRPRPDYFRVIPQPPTVLNPSILVPPQEAVNNAAVVAGHLQTATNAFPATSAQQTLTLPASSAPQIITNTMFLLPRPGHPPPAQNAVLMLPPALNMPNIQPAPKINQDSMIADQLTKSVSSPNVQNVQLSANIPRSTEGYHAKLTRVVNSEKDPLNVNNDKVDQSSLTQDLDKQNSTTYGNDSNTEKSGTTGVPCNNGAQIIPDDSARIQHLQEIEGNPNKENSTTPEGDKAEFTCPDCPKTCPTHSLWRKHLREHGKYHCEICGKFLRGRSGLSVHRKIHSTVCPYKCDVCGAAFKYKNTLDAHYAIHTGIRPYVCDICNATFARRNTLRVHRTTHNKSKDFSCHLCDAKFHTITYLRSHIKRHTDARPYSCDICNSTFKLKWVLVVHKRTHSGIRPFSCDVCGKSFVQTSALKQHYRSHTGEKPFQCITCKAFFGTKERMKAHSRKHTGERPHTCKICGKSFRYFPNLEYHRRTHSDERPYVCEKCDASFKLKHHLRNHMQTHEDNSSFRCRVCNKKLRSKAGLKRHEAEHDEDEGSVDADSDEEESGYEESEDGESEYEENEDDQSDETENDDDQNEDDLSQDDENKDRVHEDMESTGKKEKKLEEIDGDKNESEANGLKGYKERLRRSTKKMRRK